MVLLGTHTRPKIPLRKGRNTKETPPRRGNRLRLLRLGSTTTHSPTTQTMDTLDAIPTAKPIPNQPHDNQRRNPMTSKTVTDLFAGIGGFALGFTAAGFTLREYAETDTYCCAVLRRHWPHAHSLGDIKTISHVHGDIITAAPPCQPISLAGKRKGEKDERFLWDHLLRLAATSPASWIVTENPIGLLTAGSRGINWFCDGLAEIGYTINTYDIPAYTVGAPQNRRRLWIMAHAPGKRRKIRSDHTTKHEEPPHGTTPLLRCNWPPRPNQLAEIPLATDGIPRRVPGRPAKIRATGNTIIPQIAYLLARTIRTFEEINP